jgi:uncharacterized membrane protein
MARKDHIAAAVAQARRQRRWPDLRGGRLCLGLVLGPVATAAIVVAIGSFDEDTAEREILLGGAGIVIVGIAWSLIAGWIYLLAVTRWRGRITRAECLLLGIAISIFLPIAFLLLVYGVSGSDGIAGMFSGLDGPEGLIAIVLLTLTGWLGGWLFWRVGVRPAPAPAPDLAPVFD